jgi:hypothetical protein
MSPPTQFETKISIAYIRISQSICQAFPEHPINPEDNEILLAPLKSIQNSEQG